MIKLGSHCLALTIAKKTLNENRFKNAQKTMDHTPPSFQVGDRVYFKNKQAGKWDLKWRARYRIVHIKCDGCYLHVKNQATGRSNQAMSKMYMNHQLNYGTLTPNLIQQENSIILQICLPSPLSTNQSSPKELLYSQSCLQHHPSFSPFLTGLLT